MVHNLCSEDHKSSLKKIKFKVRHHSRVVRVSALSHSEWMVQSSNFGKGRNYFYSRVGDGGLSIAHIDGYVIAINIQI